jgi:tetratricopeptide (TPR) repeat protein
MDAVVDTIADVAERPLADVETGLHAAAEALHENGPAAALRIWDALVDRFRHDPRVFRGAIGRLIEQNALVEAERFAAEAVAAFPNDFGFAASWVETAYRRRDLAEALRRWSEVRARFPRQPGGFTGAALILRERKQWDDAEALLERAMGRFPGEARPVIDWAVIALERQDYPEALLRFERVRSSHPTEMIGYTGAARAACELGRLMDAEVLLEAAMKRFPNEVGVVVDHAFTAHQRRDWGEAAKRWERVRARAPDRAEGYVQGAQALREEAREEEADRLLEAGIERFPNHSNLLREYAEAASRREDWGAASARFQLLRERFPEEHGGYYGGIRAALKQYMMEQAEKLLEAAMQRWPDDPVFPLDHALIPIFHPKKPQDWNEALARLDRLRERFPAFEPAYVRTIEFLRDARRMEELEAFAAEATRRLPHSRKLARDWARAAEERGNWPEALRRFDEVKPRFPDYPDGYAGLATALAASGKTTEAERELELAMRRWPADPSLPATYAMLAMQQSDWRTALVCSISAAS